MTDDHPEDVTEGTEGVDSDFGRTLDASENEGTGGGLMNGMGADGPVDGPRDLEGFTDGTAAGATRANGLTAAYYVPLRDVDPRVGGELLVKLGGAGIAAYVAPTPSRQGTVGAIQPQAIPTDRLWVDGAKRSEAEGIIAGVTSEDEVFDQLVAMFHTSSPVDAPWPATEELGTTTRTPTWTTRRSITARQSTPAPEVTPDEPALPEHVERYLDEHFVPAPPPPLPKLHGVTILAWALIGLGILAIAFHNAIPADFSQGSNYLAALAIVGGFFTLVYRMRDNDHDDDGDGAVV
ncbi:hypothetical protein acdb102_37240 [Acidothermaceae bacterium B102]|nr:hypothetical protein acdb102_37240 [Acidothermaceae bacterium B102]